MAIKTPKPLMKSAAPAQRQVAQQPRTSANAGQLRGNRDVFKAGPGRTSARDDQFVAKKTQVTIRTLTLGNSNGSLISHNDALAFLEAHFPSDKKFA